MNDPGFAIYEFSGYRLDAVRRQLHAPDQQPVALTVKGFDILLHLVEHRGDVVEKSALMQAVWPNVIVEENNLNQNISVLRRALGERAGEHRFIVTVPGRGFRFVAPVTTQPRTASAQAGKPRLAVMPFENLSPDPTNAFFADGLHDEILATLAQRAPGLQVISRTTMMRYRANPAPLLKIAAELAATHIVEGTVRREADQVRVTLQLIDAREDRHLWAQTYDRTLHSALTLQGEVAGDVAARLAARFIGQVTAMPSRNPKAYDLYLRFRLLGQQVTPLSPPEQWKEVASLVDRAIALEPDFAACHAFRAGFLTAMYAFNYDNSDELAARIRADVAEALRLAPRDPLALAAAAGCHMWVDDDLERALTAYQAADAAGLSDSLLLSSYSMVLERMRRDDEAYELARRAVALDPANTFLICTSAIEYSILGRFLEGMRLIDRGLDIYPERRFLRLVRGQIIFLNTGRLEDLLLELDAASRQQPPSAILDLSFRVLVCARAYDELERLLESIPEDEVRAVPGPAGGGSLFGVGKRPLSHLRGWVALLRGDSSEAARQGTAVLEFLERTKTTRLNAWFRHALAADGHTFLGQREAAIAAARVTLEAMVPARDSFARFSIYHSARVLAWNGLHDEAVSLFEGDSSVNMRPTTALITRDPSITTPLAGNARFQALSQRIEGVLAERAALLDSYLGPR